LYLQTNRDEVGRQEREAKSTNLFEQNKPEQEYSSSAIQKLQHYKQQEHRKTFPVANLRSVARRQGVSVGQSSYAQNIKQVYPVINKKLQPSWQKEYENTLPSMSAGSRSMPNQQNASNQTEFYMKTAHVKELPWAENLQGYRHVVTRKSEPVYYQKSPNTLPKMVSSTHVHVPQEIQSSLVKREELKNPTQFAASYSPKEPWTNQTEPQAQVYHLSKSSFSTGMDASGDHGQKGYQETSHFDNASINTLIPTTYTKLSRDHYRKRVDLIPIREADIMQTVGLPDNYLIQLDPAHCVGLQHSGD